MLGICRIVNAVTRIYLESVLRKRRRDIILSRERVAAGYPYLGAARLERESKVCGFSLEMNRHCYLLARKRLFSRKLLVYNIKHGHIAAHPVDLIPTGGRKAHILYITHLSILAFQNYIFDIFRVIIRSYYSIPQ